MCLETPACAGFTFAWNMVPPREEGVSRDGRPPPEDAVLAFINLQKAASDGDSTECDVNASWTSVVRSDWPVNGGDQRGGWVRADNFTVVDPPAPAPAPALALAPAAAAADRFVIVDVEIPGEVARAGVDVVSVSGVRYAWERYPQCSLYDGTGGWDHREDGIAATPFCYDVEKNQPCPAAAAEPSTGVWTKPSSPRLVATAASG